MSSWISSSFSTPQNQNKKQMARHKVRPLRQDRQDRLKIFLNDWGDQDDHIETRP